MYISGTKSVFKSFTLCLLLAVAKEIYDSTTLVASWSEAIKDITVTLIYPLIFVLTSYLKKKSDYEQN